MRSRPSTWLDAKFDESIRVFRERLVASRLLLRIPPRIDIVQWLRTTVVLSKDSSAEGGTYFNPYGYQAGLARLSQASWVEDLIGVKGTRTGITQLFCGINGFHVAYEASPVGIWQPTEDKAKKFANSYWGPMFRDSPELAKLVRAPLRGEIPDRWNERLYKNGGKAYMGYASSDDQFRGDTIRCTSGDEVDADGWRVGKAGSQGNKFKLMKERSRTFWNRKNYVWSSPLEMATSNIWREWLQSDQRRYFVRCPHCEERMYLKWGGAKTNYGIKWSSDADGIVTDAWYVCDRNGCIIREEEKFGMDAEAGEETYDDQARDWDEEALGWRPTKRSMRPGLVGVHIPGYISLFAGAGWKTLAQEWLSAQGNPDDLKTFVNNVLGEPTQETVTRLVTVGGLADRAEPYIAEVPDDVICITISVDSQQGSDDQTKKGALPSRHEVSVWGWAPGEEAFLIGHFVLAEHEPFSKEAAAAMIKLVQRGWRRSDGSVLYASCTFVDAGWMINEAIDFCRLPELATWNVHPIRGMPGERNREAPIIPAGLQPSKTKNNKTFFWIGTHKAKDTLDRRLKRATPGAGYVHFPLAMALAQTEPGHPNQFYFEDLLAEGKKTDRRGREEWKRKGDRTGEAWDCLVYCYAALQMAKRQFRRIELAMIDLPTDGTEEPPPRYDGPDRSAMSDWSNHRGIVAEPIQRHVVVEDVDPSRPPAGSVPRFANPTEYRRPRVYRSSVLG